MRRSALFLALIMLLLVSATVSLAQEATPEATPAATPATTPQATPEADPSMGALLASLPQTRMADGGFVVGQPTAPITIIEFADYACPHCQAYRPVIEQVIRQYVATGQAKFELRMFPTAGGALTYYVAQLVECANHQRLGSYWLAYDYLYAYATSGKYNQDVGKYLSDDLNLKYDKLLTCANSAKQIQTDINFGERSGVTGTPAIMVRYNDGDAQFITLGRTIYAQGGVPLDVLAQVIDAANGATPEAPIQPLVGATESAPAPDSSGSMI